MNILKNNNNTYEDLKSLLRISIAGIFIVASLSYMFSSLIEKLEDKTKNSELEYRVLQIAKESIKDSRYQISQLYYTKRNYLFNYYVDKALTNIQTSDLMLDKLTYGGDIKIDLSGKTEHYKPNSYIINTPIITEQKLYDNISTSLKDIKKIYKEDRNSLKDTIKKITAKLSNRIEIINRTQNIVQNKMVIIENEIKYKKLLYFYAQIATYILIVFSLIAISKPIRKHIVQTNEELENISKEAQKMAIRSKQASKSKSEFLANMSHEIRTPLNAILGFIDLLKEKEDDKEKLQYIKTIHSSSISLLGIINDILDFSKIESGNMEIDKIDFNVEDEFTTLIDLFRSKASEKSISLVLNMDPNMPSALYSDPLRIKQVIANLISNALKFTPRNGKVVVTIRYKNERLFVSVSDTGIGIPKDKQKEIFKAFSQAESSTTRKYGGTGLGLTISSRLISLLGGTLKVESKEKEGSTFMFEIDAKVGKHKKDIKSLEINLDHIKNKNILLVEDNKANQMFMSLILKKFGLVYDIANDGLEAIKAFQNSKYDLILMDENMPNLNGIEATKTILNIEQNEDLPHTPIVALTANALKGDREKFLDSGMDEYLTKPVSKEKLALVFEKFLKEGEIA